MASSRKIEAIKKGMEQRVEADGTPNDGRSRSGA